MANKKANTIQEKFGFLDDDLKKPKHDEIMKWLDINLESILNEILANKINWTIDVNLRSTINTIPNLISNLKEKIKTKSFNFQTLGWQEETLEKLFSWKSIGDLPDKENIKVVDKIWEYPISNKNYVVGFVDLYSIVAVPFIRIDGVIRENEQYKLEPNTIPRWKIGRSSLAIAFEVKTEINSLGELIRQIRLYQKYSSSLSFFVVSPDDSQTDFLKEQKIGFYKYEAQKFNP